MTLQLGQTDLACISLALAGATVGFLRYNFNPAKIFMGDTGSMLLGYTLAAISVMGAVKTAATIALVVPAIVLGLPILDTLFAIVRRKISGRPIFKPDKGHGASSFVSSRFISKTSGANDVCCNSSVWWRVCHRSRGQCLDLVLHWYSLSS